jgi:hypothetical protein
MKAVWDRAADESQFKQRNDTMEAYIQLIAVSVSGGQDLNRR